MTDGWQPISNAPRDGTDILCVVPQWKAPPALIVLYWQADEYGPPWRDWQGHMFEEDKISHWMHIPTAPDGAEG